MKKINLLLLVWPFFTIQAGNPLKIVPCNEQYFGIDFSQLNYYIGPNSKGPNAGIFFQYHPYLFLAFNASMFVNDVRSARGQGYKELNDYHSRGMALKAGIELSLKLAPNPLNRIFFGYQEAFINYSESGTFIADNLYWGDHYMEYMLKAKNYLATEFILGLQLGAGKWIIRPQIYSIFAQHDNRISIHNEIANGYRSPFIPGYGYRRGGINFLLLYKIN